MATQSTPDAAINEYLTSLIPSSFRAIYPSAKTVISASAPRRLCTVCTEPIPAARLRAKPDAKQCVPCLEAKGDVPLLRRFDEQSAQGTVETLFTSNATLERQIGRQRSTVPGYRAENAEPSFHDEYFAAAVQDSVVALETEAEDEEV